MNEQLEQALADCGKALQLNPSDAGAITNRALVYLRLGDLDKAIAEYDIALQIDPKNAQAFYGRGLAKRDQNDNAGADADIAAAQAIRSNIGEWFPGDSTQW